MVRHSTTHRLPRRTGLYRFVTGFSWVPGTSWCRLADLDAAFRFYAETLEFLPRGALRLPTPPELGPVRLRFLGVNARHHSLAILPSPNLKAPPALVHVMVECETLDEVGRAPSTAQSKVGLAHLVDARTAHQ